MAHQAHVQADRHHLRMPGPFAQEHVEGVFDEGEPLIGRAGPAGIFPVVVGQRVGHDEVRPTLHRLPVRELVVVRVGIVEEAAFFDEQLPGVDARSVAAVPAERPLADGVLERRDRPGDVLALLLAGELVVLDPAPAVAAHVEPGAADGVRRGRVALDGQRAAEDGQGQAALLEQAHQPPEADAAAVLEHRLGREVTAFRQLIQPVRFREAALREALAVLHRRLRALLVVHDEIDGEAGAVGPFGIGRVRSIPDEIAVVGSGHVSSSLVTSTRQPASSTVKGAASVRNSSSVRVPSRHMTTAKRAGRSRTVSG